MRMTLLLILGCKLREAARRLNDNLFTVAFLGPTILIFVYFIALPYINALATGLYNVPPPNALGMIVAALITCLMVGSASSIATDCYPSQTADAYLDSLPIPLSSRFGALAIMRIIKNLPILIILMIVQYCVTSIAGKDGALMRFLCFILLPIIIQLAALQILLVLLAAHWSLLQVSRLLPLLAIPFILAIIFPGLQPWIFLPFKGAHQLLINSINGWFTPTIVRGIDAIWAIGFSAIFFLFSYLLFQKWHVTDRETVERVLGTRRATFGIEQISEAITRFTNVQVGAQLLRDLLLTFRFFTAAVYLSFAFAAIFEVGLIIYRTRFNPDMELFEIGVQAADMLAVLALAALAPTLVKHQLGFIWIERSVGLAGTEMYSNKIWYARIISFPVVLINLVIAISLGDFTFSSATFLLLKLILIWWLVASFFGALAFEIASRPSLSILFSSIASIAVACIVIKVWWIWFVLYPFIISKLEDRAGQRTRIILTGLEGDND